MKKLLIIALSVLSLIVVFILHEKIISSKPRKVDKTISIIHKSNLSIKNKLIKVAVVDTGLDSYDNIIIPKCENKLVINFINNDDKDYRNHGTNIGHIVNRNILSKYSNSYCITMFKIFNKSSDSEKQITDAMYKALDYIYQNNYDIVNMSYGGIGDGNEEKERIIKLLDKGVKIFAAAGNDSKELTNKKCYYYPACYDNRIVTVGNYTDKSSNYGNYIKQWEDGTRIFAGGHTLTGTSQATAVATNRYLRKLLDGLE